MDLDKEIEYLENRNFLFNLNDTELIDKIIEDKFHIAVIFEKYKDDYPQKLRKIFPAIDYPTIQDIYTDSICDLHDKILSLGLNILDGKNFSIAKYLKGICENKLKNEYKKNGSKLTRTDFENQNDDIYSDAVSDQIQYNNQDDLIIQQDLTYNQIRLQYQVLDIMKNKGGKCYSLILLSFSSEYNYQTIDLRKLFNYKSNHSTSNRKFRCIERLKEMYNNFQLT